jgi:hypothetical protein
MTPSKTPFAGYERLAPGDSLASDGYAFQYESPVIADRLGKLGAVTHRHDAHAAMVDPTAAATVDLAATGGTIPASLAIHVTYTLQDGAGGETLPTDPVLVTTDPGYQTPASAPTAAADYTAGVMLAGTPLYGVTVADGVGGETTLGPVAAVTIDPGHANARVLLSGLTAITNTSSGASATAVWRLWRSVDGGSTWNLMATGPYSTDAYIDDGSSGGDCTVSPPLTGTTVGANKLTVTVPSVGQPAEATFFSIYASRTSQFVVPCLLGTYPVSDFDTAKVFTALTLGLGAPPAVSSCYPGANQIDPDTDLLNWSWKQPAASFAALPSVGNADGDMRETLDTHTLYVWDAAASLWIPVGPPLSAIVAYSATVTPAPAGRNLALSIDALTGPVTIANPTGTAFDAQTIRIRLEQDGTGGRTVTFGTGYAFGTDVTAALIPSAANAKCELLFSYDPTSAKWRALAIARGF